MKGATGRLLLRDEETASGHRAQRLEDKTQFLAPGAGPGPGLGRLAPGRPRPQVTITLSLWRGGGPVMEPDMGRRLVHTALLAPASEPSS